MTRRNFSALAPLGLLLPNLLRASDAGELLKQVTIRYQGLKSFQFEGKSISQSTINEKSSETETRFTVAFEAPNKFRLEFRYPSAGNWLRVSDGQYLRESRSITKESKRRPAEARDLHVLKGSPHYNFERLSQTAVNPFLMLPVYLEIGGRQVHCDLLQFEAGRREMRKGESPGPRMVWISRADQLVLREEIRTSSKTGNVLTESKRITLVEQYNVNQPLPPDIFNTQ